MGTKRNSRKNGTTGPARLGKPNGIVQPWVQKVGPERFGIVAIDCAKARSKWMFCDFYGKVLVPPTEVEHARMQMQLATVQFKEACQQHKILDAIVAVEMTGTYHRPIQRAFRKAGVETRLVHPFASKQYRLPSHGDIKTDDNDLEGIFRAAVNGFGLLEPVWDETHLWTRPVAIAIARHATSAEASRRAGIPGITRRLREEKLRFQARTIEKVVGVVVARARRQSARCWSRYLPGWASVD